MCAGAGGNLILAGSGRAEGVAGVRVLQESCVQFILANSSPYIRARNRSNSPCSLLYDRVVSTKRNY